MLLAIDIGNTNVVFGLFDKKDNQKPLYTWRCATKSQKTEDEYAVWFLALMQHTGLKVSDITGAVMASVVPSVTRPLEQFCKKYLSVKPLLIKSTELDLGLSVKIDRPQEVGADRVVNAAAALAYHGKPPFIIVDFGTATTFDIVDAQGDYCGGIIAPGPKLSLETLHNATAKLPKIDMVRPMTNSVIGKNTIHAMQSGVYWGYLSLIEGLVKRLRSELGGHGKVIATGGLATLFERDAHDLFDVIDGDLTMKGLVMLYHRNYKNLKNEDSEVDSENENKNKKSSIHKRKKIA